MMSGRLQVSPMRQRPLNIASIVCLVACVALMGMWVRSYRRDLARWRRSY